MRHLVLYKRSRPMGFEDEVRRSGYDYDQQYYDDDRYEYDKKKHYRSYSDYEDPRYDYEEDDYEGFDDRKRYRRHGIDGYEMSRKRSASFVLPNEHVANLIMEASSFGEYIAKHGYHFTAKLADCATKMLVNANNKDHRWTSDQIRLQLAIHGISDIGKCTLGDITFLANMAYADFYPEILTSEQACIKYALAVSKDPDGYDGVVFSRWIADLIGRKITTIEWEDYV